MFYLHTSNKTENLLHHFAALIEADPPSSFFEKEYIVIQSQGMERMICQFMADSFTSWCNFGFFLPLSFLKLIAEMLEMEITPDSFDRSVLVWRIEEKLRSLDDVAFAPLRKYFEGGKSKLKRYQLAYQLGNIYDQYQLMRPQMLSGWENGILCSAEPVEKWQMMLWRKLVADDPDACHRGRLMQRIIDNLHDTAELNNLPRRVSFFGLNTVPPVFLDYLSALSQHLNVHLFLLSPCRRYWGDMKKQSGNINTASPGVDHHPLLVSLGRLGRDFHELLLDRVEIADEISSYEDPLVEGELNILQLLQSDLLDGRVGEKRIVGSSDCLRIVSCHTRQRELNVLKDHILDMLNRDETLQLSDIVVMAPDIQDYASFLPAHFEDIQHSIADRSLHRRNSFFFGIS